MTNINDLMKQAALEFARANAIVLPGNFVWTDWGGTWKKPHRVLICEVGAALVAVPHFDPQKQEWPLTFEMTYYALRLRADGTPKDRPGCGIVLRQFTTESGVEWKQSKKTINDCAVHWRLPESLLYVPEEGDMKG